MVVAVKLPSLLSCKLSGLCSPSAWPPFHNMGLSGFINVGETHIFFKDRQDGHQVPFTGTGDLALQQGSLVTPKEPPVVKMNRT